MGRRSVKRPAWPPRGAATVVSHIYADNGKYAVKVTVKDDDSGEGSAHDEHHRDQRTPTLTVVGDQSIAEGSSLSIIDIGTFTDPGFDNPLNVNDPMNGGETVETFTYAIDWGDNMPTCAGVATIDVIGGELVSTQGSFNGQHTYADDGVYTVTVLVLDDDMGLRSEDVQGHGHERSSQIDREPLKHGHL